MKRNIQLRIRLIVFAIVALFQLVGFTTTAANATVTTASTVKVTSVSLNMKNLSLLVGKTESLKATILPTNAANKEVTWKSSNAKVSTVDGDGKVAAVGAGKATITCTTKDGNKVASCAVTVSESKYLNVVGPTKDGFTYTFKGINVNFDSDVKVPSNWSKIKITNSKGVQVPISKVNTTISTKEFQMYCPSMTDGKYTLFIPANTISDVSGKKYNKDIKIVFNVKLISVKSVSLNKTTDNLTLGSSDILKASITPSNATNKDLTWKSSNAKVATVDGDGKVTALGVGKATITCTAKDGNKVASCVVTVNESKYLNVVGPTKDGFTYTFKGINVNFDSDVKVPSNWSKIKIINSKGVQVPISKVNTTIFKKEFQMYCPSMTDGKYTLFIPANTISDVSGKKYNKDIKIVFNVKLETQIPTD